MRIIRDLFRDLIRNGTDLILIHPVNIRNLIVRRLDRANDLLLVEIHFLAVPFNDVRFYHKFLGIV